MNTTTTKSAVIEDLKNAMRKGEMALARLPASAWVILWGSSPLKTDGARVGLLGTAIYSGSQAAMEQEAGRFELKVADMERGEPVRAMSSTDALAFVQQANAALLAAIPE